MELQLGFLLNDAECKRTIWLQLLHGNLHDCCLANLKQRNDLIFNRAGHLSIAGKLLFCRKLRTRLTEYRHPKKIHFHCSFPCTDRFPLPFGGFGAVCWFLFLFLYCVLCLSLLYINKIEQQGPPLLFSLQKKHINTSTIWG
jgi:hypothetical protein